MKARLASLFVILATSGPALSATELERLRALVAEQEMQIKQLEFKIARLTDTSPPTHAAAPSEPARATSSSTTYTVKAGDSLERIARKQGRSTAELAKFNGLKPASIIHPGQKLKIPGTAPIPSSSSVPSSDNSITHTVAAGDTFYKIATKHGVTVDQLIASNPGVNHKALRPGQIIKINKPASQQTTKATAAPPSKAIAEAPSFSQSASMPVSNVPAAVEKPRASDRPIKIEKEITYGQFAVLHGTTTRRLDELNGLELDASTVLAQGSELYIPVQP